MLFVGNTNIHQITHVKLVTLVTLCEGEPDLWDSSSKNYKNKHAREVSLERIVLAMDVEGFTTKDCRIKIENIRSHYWQEVSKINQSIASGDGTDQVYKPTVIWFASVDGFLRRFAAQHTKGNLVSLFY
jgi:hypothetical protein